MDDEKGYEVVDKRGIGDEEAAESRSEEAPPESKAEQEAPQGVADVYNLLRLFIAMLAENAWVWMGLRRNPVTGKVEKDLAQARVAIDTLVFLSDKLAPHADERERRDMRTIVGDLQLNFVQQSSKGD